MTSKSLYYPLTREQKPCPTAIKLTSLFQRLLSPICKSLTYPCRQATLHRETSKLVKHEWVDESQNKASYSVGRLTHWSGETRERHRHGCIAGDLFKILCAFIEACKHTCRIKLVPQSSTSLSAWYMFA